MMTSDAADNAPLAGIDVSDPALYENHSYHGLFRRLRRDDPVHWCEMGMWGPYWSITRYKDVVHVEKNHAVFSSDYRRGGISLNESVVPGGASLITTDPPEHTTLRAAVAPAFSSRNLDVLEKEIRVRAAKIVRSLPVDETFDWVEHVANELPLQMLAVLLGVPQEDRRRLLRWSNLIIGINNSDIAPDPEREVAELQEFGAYFLGLLAERSKAKDGPDLISLLAHSEVGKELSPSDYVGTVALLVVGGNDTTRNSISGGLLALVENPIEYRKLRDDRALIPSAVSEMIRWVSPVAHMCRTAVSDYRLRGKKIREGDRVVLWYVSANRDEEVFSEADRFLVERYRPGSREPRHLSFGAGIHFCLGARLAEMQLRCLWEEVLDRYPQIDLAVAPLRVHSSFVNGFKSLPVRIASRP